MMPDNNVTKTKRGSLNDGDGWKTLNLKNDAEDANFLFPSMQHKHNQQMGNAVHVTSHGSFSDVLAGSGGEARHKLTDSSLRFQHHYLHFPINRKRQLTTFLLLNMRHHHI